jgi:hypothetical protein
MSHENVHQVDELLPDLSPFHDPPGHDEHGDGDQGYRVDLAKA